MPTFRQRFTGTEPEDFPGPPIAHRLQPGDIVEYEADEPVAHARLELLAEESPGLDWTTPAHGLCRVGRVPPDISPASADTAPTAPPKTRKAAVEEPASPAKED